MGYFQFMYASRVVIYERKMFKRLARGSATSFVNVNQNFSEALTRLDDEKC